MSSAVSRHGPIASGGLGTAAPPLRGSARRASRRKTAAPATRFVFSLIPNVRVFRRFVRGYPAGNAYVGVSASGELLPCFFIPISLGNVNRVSLEQAWEKACQSPLFCKKHKMCYAGTGREFVCGYLEPIFESGRVPMPIEDHPRFEPSLAGIPDLAIADVEADAEYSRGRE